MRIFKLLKDERGSATAELAIIMPVIIVLIAILVGSATLSAASSQVSIAASAAARSLARGESEAQAGELAAAASPDGKLQVKHSGGQVCAAYSKPAKILALAEFEVKDEICAIPNGL